MIKESGLICSAQRSAACVVPPSVLGGGGGGGGGVAPDEVATGSCAYWCDGKGISHCAHRECASCDFCGGIVACTPIKKDGEQHARARASSPPVPFITAHGNLLKSSMFHGRMRADLRHESCELWCNPQHAKSHCPACACRACEFCTPAKPAVAEKPRLAPTGAGGDDALTVAPVSPDASVSVATTGAESKPAVGYNGLPLNADGTAAIIPAAAPPDGLGVTSSTAAAEPAKPTCLGSSNPTGTCGQWCNEAHLDVHCQSCACQPCAFCVVHAREKAAHLKASGTTTDACIPHDKSDINHAACERFCLPMHAKSHCSLCRCKHCDFCRPAAAPSPAALAPSHDGGSHSKAAAKGGSTAAAGVGAPPPPSAPVIHGHDGGDGSSSPPSKKEKKEAKKASERSDKAVGREGKTATAEGEAAAAADADGSSGKSSRGATAGAKVGDGALAGTKTTTQSPPPPSFSAPPSPPAQKSTELLGPMLAAAPPAFSLMSLSGEAPPLSVERVALAMGALILLLLLALVCQCVRTLNAQERAARGIHNPSSSGGGRASGGLGNGKASRRTESGGGYARVHGADAANGSSDEEEELFQPVTSSVPERTLLTSPVVKPSDVTTACLDEERREDHGEDAAPAVPVVVVQPPRSPNDAMAIRPSVQNLLD